MVGDLHLHSHYSYDARNSVKAIFESVKEKSGSLLAITEHHNMRSIPEALEVAKNYPGIRYIPALEATVMVDEGFMDMICLGVDYNHPGVQEFQNLYQKWTEDFLVQMYEGFEIMNIDFDQEFIAELIKDFKGENFDESIHEKRPPYRAIRAILQKQGYAKNEEEAAGIFIKALEKGGTAKRVCPPSVTDVAPLIHSFCKIVSIAHPVGYFRGYDEKRIDYLREMTGCNGIECSHPTISDELGKKYREYCRREGLVSTAGSDSHYQHELDKMCCGFGEKEWFEEILERLE